MSWEVHCPCCLRQERWLPEGPQVEQEGGQRKPADGPELAAWRTIQRARNGELGPVVGRCSGCGQPLVARDPACPEHAAWTFHTPAGEYTVNGEIEGPEGVTTAKALGDYLLETYQESEELTPAQTLFTMTVLSFMTVPILLWIVTGIIVATILLNFSSSTQVFVPDY
jgi:hypothetical protein